MKRIPEYLVIFKRICFRPVRIVHHRTEFLRKVGGIQVFTSGIKGGPAHDIIFPARKIITFRPFASHCAPEKASAILVLAAREIMKQFHYRFSFVLFYLPPQTPVIKSIIGAWIMIVECPI